MRIVGGKLRGRPLIAPEDRGVRPTSERAREAVFDHLAHAGYGPGGTSILVDAVALDVFCGTGAMGLEAVSRGAAQAVFLDLERRSLDLARQNAQRLDVFERCKFVRADATAPPPPPPGGQPATIVMIDPPFKDAVGVPALVALAEAGWLAPDAVVAVGRPSKRPPAETPEGFELMFSRKYGAGSFEVYVRG